MRVSVGALSASSGQANRQNHQSNNNNAPNRNLSTFASFNKSAFRLPSFPPATHIAPTLTGYGESSWQLFLNPRKLLPNVDFLHHSSIPILSGQFKQFATLSDKL
jgi:hypothetical protein